MFILNSQDIPWVNSLSNPDILAKKEQFLVAPEDQINPLYRGIRRFI
jgi:hypothetical protein